MMCLEGSSCIIEVGMVSWLGKEVTC